jgi:prepilin-type N-terminal cleavage/methylation domain-containing protein
MTRQTRLVRSKRSGFTLGEVLVTVAIISVLAAVVIPAIGSQITKGDLGRISNDLLSVRGGMEQFLSDVRRYPNSVGQLTNAISVGTTYGPLIANQTCPGSPSFTTQYTTLETQRWRGPYLSKDSVGASGIPTGYSTSIRTCFSTLTVGTSGVVDASGIKYAVVLVPGINSATALTIDAAMDDGVVTTGALRWASGGGGATPDTLKLLALPIQP